MCYWLNGIRFGETLEFSAAAFGRIYLFIPGAVAGAIVLFAIARLAVCIKFLCYIGKNSMIYYLIHYFYVSLVGEVTDHTIISFVIVLAGTTVTVFVYNKLGIGRFFQGGKR